jgi:arylsulfatase A-like enzyme
MRFLFAPQVAVSAALAIMSLVWVELGAEPVHAVAPLHVLPAAQAQPDKHSAATLVRSREQESRAWTLLPSDALGPLAKVVQRTPADLVVVVSIDGLRPDVITPAMKSLHRLYLQGSSARVARTISKSATLPSHASMVSGVDADEHGLDFNAYRPERGNIGRPTMFSVAHQAGLPTYMFVGKAKLKHLLGKPSDAQLKVVGGGCRRLIKEAQPQLQQMKRGVLFMHFADPDSAGHRTGWMTDPYVAAVHDADACLENVMETIEKGGHMERTLLVVTSDHGGHGRSHGTRMEVDQRIPWYAWGANSRRGRTRAVHTTDTAATTLSALGLKLPEHMHGQPVMEAIGGTAGSASMPLIGPPVAQPGQ